MIVTDISLNQNMEEKILYQNPLLQHSMYEVEYDHYQRALIPWHWHDELELLYLESGACRYRTIREDYYLKAGDAIYLNPGVLHAFEPLLPNTVSCANIFRREFLGGNAGSYWDTTFLTPVLHQREVEALLFYHDDPRAQEMLSRIRETIRLCRAEPRGYELALRSTLLTIWQQIYICVTDRTAAGTQMKTDAWDDRLKKMLLFINENYDRPIAVAAIADAAHISERECYRLFRQLLGVTPTIFVQQYRLQRAKVLLLGSNDTVTAVTDRVGFESAAYFSKLFKRFYGQTPLQVRKQHLAESL